MPHGARQRSESGYYHVVVKGIGDRILFEHDADRRYFIGLLDEAKGHTGVLLHAYCLMSNHVHLVIEDPDDVPSAFMKRVDERYGTYVADKTGLSGGVLRKPYWSEPIESDEYLLCAVRYVHANPAVAGICPASAYEWSSAKDYLGRKGIADTATVLGMCDGIEGFIRFSREDPASARAFPGSKLIGHVTDDEALRIAHLALGEEPLSHLGSLDRTRRDDALRRLKNTGLTIRQIARITGLGMHAIQCA